MPQKSCLAAFCLGCAILIPSSFMSAAAPPRESGVEAIAAGVMEFNGQSYLVQKSIVGGQEVRTFTSNGATFNESQLRAYVAQQQPRIIEPDLQVALEKAAPDDLINVVIVLRTQPAAPIAREVRAALQPQVDQLTSQIQAISRQALPNQPMNAQQEKAFAPQPFPEGAMQARRALAQQLDELKTAAMKDIFERAANAVAPSQAQLTQAIDELGGEVTASISAMNILAARLSAAQIPALANHPLVASIDIDHPNAPELDNHQNSLGLVTGFWAKGINGGVHDCGVLDTGVQQNHPSLSSHTFLSNAGTTDTNGHGTGMAGILASTHNLYRGMAFGLDKIVVAMASGTDSISMTGMNYIASTGEPENVNYSFGNGTANSNDYSNLDRFFDGVISTFGYMVSKSTGNGGYHATNPTITHPAPAFNLMASANMDDFNTVARTDDRITSSSSVGPTVTGRKKPDITSPGNNTMSCTPAGGFANIGGTSSASPHTGGGIILLHDLGVSEVMACKAVLLNTTDAITDSGTSSTADDQYVQGSLWNRRYGWGYMNLGNAFLHGLDVFINQVPPTPEDADFKLYKGPAFAFDKFTLVWQRHVAYNGAAYPTNVDSLSDLDLRAFRESDDAQLGASASAIDNVEQLHVTTNEASIVLKVEAFGGFDPDIPTERFALATQENFTAASGPAFTVNFDHPASVSPNQTFTLAITATNSGDLKAHNVTAQVTGAAVVSGSNPASLAAVGVAAQGGASWTLQAPNSNGNLAIAVTLRSNSYGEVFTSIANSNVILGSFCPDITGEGQVNVNDLLAVINAWGPCPAPPATCPSDVDPPGGNGVVNVNDLLAVINAWGPCP